MKELVDKLSSYNIFNYLLPGIVFVVLADVTTSFKFVQKDIVLGVFLYYFIGLIISRIGSIILEPILRLIKFVNFASYADFVSASKEDKSLEVLSEANNMYRTLCSVLLLLITLIIFDWFSSYFSFLRRWSTTLLIFGLLVLFLFSYRKQTQYITKRIQIYKERS